MARSPEMGLRRWLANPYGSAQQPGQVVEERDDHQAHHHDKPHLLGDLPEALGKWAALERFERVLYQTPAVEYRNR